MKFKRLFCVALAIVGIYIFSPKPTHAVYPLGTEVVMYHFEDIATGTTTDATTGTTTNSGSSGVSNDGLLMNNASTTSNVKLFGSRSAVFGETLDFMKTYFGNGVNPTTDTVAVSFWIYKGTNTCNTSDDDHVFGVSGSPTANRFYVRCKTSTTNKWNYRIQGNADVFSTASISTTGWDHIVLSAASTTDTVSFYVNNTLIATAAAYTTFTFPGNFYVGNFNDTGAGDLAQGSGAHIDEVAIYSLPLTASDVNVLYQAGIAGGAVSSLTATPFENKAYLAWTAGSGTTTDYLIEYKLTADSTWTTFSDGVSTTANATVTGLTNGSSYDFRVTPKNGEVPGTVSSTVVTTPFYRIGFITPTPTHGSTVAASTFTVYASTTPVTASTTDIIRLEDSNGSLISQVSTSTRYGDYNLRHLANTLSGSNLALLDNSSGIAYVPTTDSLFVVHNRAIGVTSTIDELDRDGVVIRSINCTSCGDIEGITLLSTVASSTATGYDHTFMISTENDLTNGEIFRVTLHSTGTTAVNRLDYYNPGIAHGSNVGLEGIAYNPTSGAFYVATEMNLAGDALGALYEVTLGSGHSATSAQICTNLSWAASVDDFSDLFYVSTTSARRILYVLTEESGSALIPVDITSTSSCAFIDSDGDGSTNADTGDYLTSLAVGVTDQAEGVTWDPTGDTMWVLGEADFLARYRPTSYTTRHTFSGLSNGNYILKATSLDTVGNTANASSTAITINVDVTVPSATMTAPSDAATVSGASVTVSASASDDTAVAGVTFKVDTNTAIGVEDTTSAYSVSWDSTGVSDGSHTLLAVARDTANNLATSTAVTVTVDNTAPVRSSGAPTGTLAAGTTGTTISLSTNETATCKYSTSAATAYGSMTAFSSTNSTSHSSSVTGLSDGNTYTYYVKCLDGQANTNATDYSGISFSVATDVDAPLLSVISSGTPGSSSATITWTTDESASSRVSFGLTSSSLSSSTPERDTSSRVTSHSVDLSSLSACTVYNYTVTSRDATLNSATSTVYTFNTDGCTGSASVEDSTAESVTTASGGTVDLVTSSRGPTLTIPSGFSGANADFQIKKLDSDLAIGTTGLPSGLILSSDHLYDFKAYSDVSTAVTSFSSAITVTIQYSAADVSGVVESSLTIKRWDGSSWNDLTSCSVDTSGNSVTCSTSSFSVFGLFGSEDTSSSGNTTTSSSGSGNNRYLSLVRQGLIAQAAGTVASTSIATPVLSGKARLIKALSFGSIDATVRIVQQILNLAADTRVASAGAGSPGKETTTFYGLTRNAVQKFQFKYKIVTSSKDPGYGFVGPATRKKMNEFLGY